jgi:hypothetical protein
MALGDTMMEDDTRTKLVVPLDVLRAKLRRILRHAGYDITVELTLARTDGAPLTDWDRRGLPTLLTAWQKDQAERRQGIQGERARDAIDRAVETGGPLLRSAPGRTTRPAQSASRKARTARAR